jgi:hypothetical protein
MLERNDVTERIERDKERFRQWFPINKYSTLANRILNLVSRPHFNEGPVDAKLRDIQYLLDHPYSCKFCGMPTDTPQEDQERPKDYCHHD